MARTRIKNKEESMYLYIHGFNSDTTSRSYFDLCKILDDVSALSYDYTKPAKYCFMQLCEQVETYINDNKVLVILGSSLGGFWALHIAKKYNLPCVVFNPVTFSHEQLQPFLGINQNFYTQKKWDFTEETLMSYADFTLDRNLAVKPHIVLGKKDEVLDYQIALAYWNKYAHCIVGHEEHSIMDYSKYQSLILSLSQNTTSST